MEDVREGWHLKKELSVGHILLTITVVFSTLWWATTVETRLVELAVRDVAFNERMGRDDVTIRDSFQRIERSLARIEEKIDGE